MHRKGEGNSHRPSSKPQTDEVIEARMYFCEEIVGLGQTGKASLNYSFRDFLQSPTVIRRLDCDCADCEVFRLSLNCSPAPFQKRCK